MDIRDVLNAVSETAMGVRSEYHLTLGGLISKLGEMPADTVIQYEDGKGPATEESYRGYYSDLSFPDGEPVHAGKLLEQCKSALGSTYMGYKGGDYVMTEKTPLWRSEYGEASGVAIMNIFKLDGKAIITTKQIDD